MPVFLHHIAEIVAKEFSLRDIHMKADKLSFLCTPNMQGEFNTLSGKSDALFSETKRICSKACFFNHSLLKQTMGPHEDLLIIVKRRKLKKYSHSCRSSGLAKNHLARHSKRGKKTRQTEKEVGRQHQRVDRPGVRQVPEGSGERGKMEKTGCEIICGAPTTLAVKG